MRTQKHVALQSVALQAAIAALYNLYKDIEGSYSSTLIYGVAHYMLDSGIYSDSFSVNDAQLIQQRTAHLTYDSEEWYAAVHNMHDLQCNKLLAAIYALEKQYDNGAKDSTGCTYLADDIVNALCELEGH